MTAEATEARPAPKYSIVTPVYNTPLGVLREMIDSVRQQTYTDWELILVDDLSPEQAVRDTLQEAAREDPRIVVIERTENGHIVAASNDGVDAARGEFIVLVDHDDLILPEALEIMDQAIGDDPDVGYAYSDEDKIDDDGVPYDPFRKPGWSPERLRGQMYTSHLGILRTSLVREVGGFHQGFDGSQDHDLVLRVTEQSRKVVHVPHVLYHWRVIPGSAAGDPHAKPYAWVAGRKAVEAHLERTGIKGRAEFGELISSYKVVRDPIAPEVQVSVVIASRGLSEIIWGEKRVFLAEAVRSVIARGGHDNVEIVLVHDSRTSRAQLELARSIAGERLLLVPTDDGMSICAQLNLGVLRSHGSVVIMLGERSEVISDGFVHALVAPLSEPGVGMTGARLVHADRTILHDGVRVEDQDVVLVSEGTPDSDVGHLGILRINHEVDGLPTYGVALRRSTFEAVGGLSEQLTAKAAGVDLSLKVRQRGLRLLWIADATVARFEPREATIELTPDERGAFLRRWRSPHSAIAELHREIGQKWRPDRPIDVVEHRERSLRLVPDTEVSGQGKADRAKPSDG